MLAQAERRQCRCHQEPRVPVTSSTSSKMLLAVMAALLVVSSSATPFNQTDLAKPDVYSVHVESVVKHRYAVTRVTSKVANPAATAQQVRFTMHIPQTAFISSFKMIINGKEYKALVKERDTAKKEYEAAVSSGQSAAHVETNARDSNKFSVSVSVASGSKMEFQLVYEELLVRSLGLYTLAINLNPGQIVRDFKVDVAIHESTDIVKLHVPKIKSSNQIIDESDRKGGGGGEVLVHKKGKAVIRWRPTAEEQAALSETAGRPWSGQFIVQYDVERTPGSGGQVLVNEGYFVHFFSPPELKPLNKYAVFVLDVSGSMEGRKLEQLKEAMNTILEELSPGDYFSLVDFSYSVTVHDLDSVSGSLVLPPEGSLRRDLPVPTAYPATPYYIARAKQVIAKMSSVGGTNIYDAVKNGLLVGLGGLESLKENGTEGADMLEPIVIFLTDGDPTVGVTSHKKILAMAKDINNNRCALFCLGFGEEADMGFLRKLSLSNSGFARTIYEASDAVLQLSNFYRQVASPLLANVTFTYLPSQVKSGSVTKTAFHSLFLGSELVVSGQVQDQGDLEPSVTALTADGPATFNPKLLRKTPDNIDEIEFIEEEGEKEREEREDSEEEDEDKKSGGDKGKKGPKSGVERLWAYLTVKQSLDRREVVLDRNQTEAELLRRLALHLALKYKFVTPLTSLVVVKPNGTSEVDTDSIKPTSLKDKQSSAGLQTSLAGFAPDEESLYLMAGISPNNKLFIDRFDEEVEYEEEDDKQEDSLLWLPYHIDKNNSLLLPVGPNRTIVPLKFLTDPGQDADHECMTQTGEEGSCVHLAVCVTPNITQTLDDYLKYFCRVTGGYAGVCCVDMPPGPIRSALRLSSLG